MKRRWTVRTRRPNGEEVWVVIAVPAEGGAVYAQCGDSIVMLDPEAVSRLRRAFQEAQQVALQDQGVW